MSTSANNKGGKCCSPNWPASKPVLPAIAANATGPLSMVEHSSSEQYLDSSQAGKIEPHKGQDSHSGKKSYTSKPHSEALDAKAKRAARHQLDKAGPTQRPEPVVGGRAGRARETPPTVGVLCAYIPPSWHHPKGVHKVIRRLLIRFPDVAGMLFHTFTLDHNLFNGPASAFEYARKRLRKVYAALRKGILWEGKLYKIDAPYCVKVEFHEDEDGWPHFHTIQLTRRYIPGELLAHLWKLGWVYSERIKKNDFDYLFNYVTKGSSYPEWVLSLRRLRVFQSSRGFLKPVEIVERSKDGRKKIKRPRASYNIGERIERWNRTALLNKDGRYRAVMLSRPYQETFDEQIHVVSEENRYLGLGLIKINKIADLIKWKLKIQIV